MPYAFFDRQCHRMPCTLSLNSVTTNKMNEEGATSMCPYSELYTARAAKKNRGKKAKNNLVGKTSEKKSQVSRILSVVCGCGSLRAQT